MSRASAATLVGVAPTASARSEASSVAAVASARASTSEGGREVVAAGMPLLPQTADGVPSDPDRLGRQAP